MRRIRTANDRTFAPIRQYVDAVNKSYWSSTIGSYLTQGDPRSVWLSMTTDF